MKSAVLILCFLTGCGAAVEEDPKQEEIELVYVNVGTGETADITHSGDARASFLERGEERWLQQLKPGGVGFDRRDLEATTVTLYGVPQFVKVSIHNGPTECKD